MAGIVISQAQVADVDGIFELAWKNARENGGQLAVRFTREEIASSVQASSAAVARRKGKVIGFVLTRDKCGVNPPILEAMFRAYPGAANAYSYGPVCVDASARGSGIAAMMFAELRKLLPGREGVLFIKASNETSLRAHRKMDMREVGEFTFENTRLIIFAYDA
ncbi:MAG TPA: GNAT family N-acetyltransferase [Candidatus Acidoferrales bacterium]|nr:GNAT family N-acetyltransferase [Candidatus Acidoferrales bacterium]